MITSTISIFLNIKHIVSAYVSKHVKYIFMNLKSINEVLEFGFSSLSVTFIAIMVIIILHNFFAEGGADSAQATELCVIYSYLASPECW